MLLDEYVESIYNQVDDEIPKSVVESNEKPGWKPSRKSDHLDIKLAITTKIVKIAVDKNSNVASFNVKLQDTDLNLYKFNVRLFSLHIHNKI
jgi:hypothetical protein